MTQERRYLTPAEAADELRVSTDTILRLVRSGELPAVRVSSRIIRIPRPAFELFRDGRTPRPRRVITRRSSVDAPIGAGEGIPRRELV